jgi:hypothetical protein
MEFVTGQISDLRQRLQGAKADRNRLQNDLDALMKQPFFREQADSSNIQCLEKLQA